MEGGGGWGKEAEGVQDPGRQRGAGRAVTQPSLRNMDDNVTGGSQDEFPKDCQELGGAVEGKAGPRTERAGEDAPAGKLLRDHENGPYEDRSDVANVCATLFSKHRGVHSAVCTLRVCECIPRWAGTKADSEVRTVVLLRQECRWDDSEISMSS